MFLAGVDIGTTGSKCAVFDYTGKMFSSSYCEYNIETAQKGYYELNPKKVKQVVLSVIRDAAIKAGSTDCIYILISSMGEACVGVDEKGRILGNSILFIDKRGTNEVRDLCRKIDKNDIMERAGVSPHSMYTLPKILWIKKK